jgi:hypothetical protein
MIDHLKTNDSTKRRMLEGILATDEKHAGDLLVCCKSWADKIETHFDSACEVLA